jgi:hypothetical protein
LGKLKEIKSLKIYHSFKEQEADEIRYWKGLSGEQKLDALESIRANYWAMNHDSHPRF